MGRMKHFKFCHFSILLKIRRLLGHKTPAMTQQYAHHYPESLRDAVEVLIITKNIHLVHFWNLTNNKVKFKFLENYF